MISHFKIGKYQIGDHCPAFIIAEAGVNHNGKLSWAKKMVDVAYDCGANAIKFQTYRTESIILQNTKKAKYQLLDKAKESQYQMLKRLELGPKDFAALAQYTKKKKMVFLSTPFDNESVDLLADLDVPAFKVASGELTNYPLLKYISKKGRPMILSTGMATIEEISNTLKFLSSQGFSKGLALMHCTSDYPTKTEDVNLRVITSLKKRFKVPVGFSDHSLGIHSVIGAVSLGACIIEKHFTLNKKYPGPDHRASLSPEELKQMVDAIRATEIMLGTGVKGLTSEEKRTKTLARRSIVVRSDIPKGSRIKEDMITYKRPGKGLSPQLYMKVIGKRAKRDLKKDHILSWSDIG
jgi:N,N'-diacetyllegionaminate synthase